MTRAADLQTFLMEAVSTPFQYGLHDCCTFATDWCVYAGHDDPMAAWRGQYDSEEGADALIAECGGLLPMWELGMIEAQLPEADEPRLGDVAVLRVMTDKGPGEVGAIYGGKRWHMLSPNGMFSASMEREHILRIWRV